LLVGPPGSGKTASVYACAEELGWEVFEVYPGIGRRNGSSIENLVGEVGKNHLVRQKPHGRHDFLPFGSPTKRKQGFNLSKSEPGSERDRSSVPLAYLDIDNSERDQPPSLGQSLILLEEVDILFKEDVRFWDSVKEVIRECKRPIICTCNGKYSWSPVFRPACLTILLVRCLVGSIG
jgi:DNA polymerase III delta prime subunit